MIQINGLKTNQMQRLLGLGQNYQNLEKQTNKDYLKSVDEELVRMLKKITKYCLEVKKNGK
jgi:hypothetical protein